MSEFQIEMFWKCKACNEIVKGRFVECSKCGKPKTEDVEYFMPEDLESAPKVEDKSLLAIAQGGANYNCIYCGSDQRNNNGECYQCGAAEKLSNFSDLNVKSSFEEKKEPAKQIQPEPEIKIPKLKPNYFIIFGCFIFVCILAFAFYPKKIKANIEYFHWETSAKIEKRSIYHYEGFNPTGFNVVSLGERFHHNDKVFDRYDQQPYSSVEPDGFRTESYTENQACGQTCVPVPKTCTTTPRNCTSNKNGFATCTGGNQVCSGGGQSCSTKYCTVSKTRQVLKTKVVTKYRQISIYKDVPRYQQYYSWDQWEWRYSRSFNKSGNDQNFHMPNESDMNLLHSENGEQERVVNITKSFEVGFVSKDKKYKYNSTESEFLSFKKEYTYILEVNAFAVISVTKLGNK